MDIHGVMARVSAFDERHGGRANSVQSEGGWIYYRDGARRECEPLGALIEPPTDPYELAMAKLNYAKARLDQAQSAFDQLKETLLHSTPGEKDELERLKGCKQGVEFCQAAFSKAQQALAETETFQQRQRAKAGIAERKQLQANWRNKVLAVAGVAEPAE